MNVPYGWVAVALFAGLSLVAMVRQQDAWPFSHYPMFSRRIAVEDLVVFRIALENASGQVVWWQPRFFRFQDRLGARFSELVRESSQGPASSPALLELFARTERLILADAPSADCVAVLFIRRRIERNAGAFVTRDDVAARVPWSTAQARDRRAAARS